MTALSPFEEAEQILFLMSMDIEEEDKTRLICEHHRQLDQDLYLEVWALLDSKARSSWKRFIEEGKLLKLQGQL